MRNQLFYKTAHCGQPKRGAESNVK